MANRCALTTHQAGLAPNWQLSAFDSNWDNPVTAHNDSSLGQINGIPTDTGSANNYIVALPFGAPSAYQQGMTVVFLPANTNTAGSTLTVSPLTSVTILDFQGNALLAGAIQASTLAMCIFDGTNFRLFNVIAPVPYLTFPQAIWGRKQLFDDFTVQAPNFLNGGSLESIIPWEMLFNGVGSSVGYVTSSTGVDGFNKVLGGLALHPGTSATGYSNLFGFLQGYFFPAQGALDIWFRFAVSSIPTAAQNTSFRFGVVTSAFANAWPTANQIDLLMFNNGTNAVWRGECIAASTSSVTSDATTPTIGAVSSSSLTYYKGHISINSTWTSVSFFINGVQIGSAITTNIPTTAVLSPIISCTNTAGSTDNALYIDAYGFDYQYSTP